MERMSRKVAIAEADLPALVDEVTKTQEEIVLTKDGTPVALVVPLSPSRGPMYGTIKFTGDIESPIEDPWDAER